MSEDAERSDRRRLLPAEQGSGPLLQRDYWAVLDGFDGSAPDLARVVAHHFPRFGTRELVSFDRASGAAGALEPGEDMDVRIRMAGRFAVRVVHRDDNSLTIATLEGHPEAGRITFGAYPNEAGEIVFHIRSRARSSSGRQRLGFFATGDPMQTLTWSGFIDRLAASVGASVRDVVHAETREVPEEVQDRRGGGAVPTFRAVGER